MKRIAGGVGLFILIWIAVCAHGQPAKSTPPPELRKLNVWVGDWVLSGMAKDAPGGREYQVDWRLHEHWILNGSFLQVDQTWKGDGQESRALEMLFYDAARKTYTDSGFGSDGSTWSLTATFRNHTMVESGATAGSDGRITRCEMTWQFSKQGTALSGTEVCEQNGARWTAIDVRGTKSRVRP